MFSLRGAAQYSILAAVGVTTSGLGTDLKITSLAPYAGKTNIVVEASGNVSFTEGILQLPTLPVAATGRLCIHAGGGIVIPHGAAISAGPGWSIILRATRVTNKGQVIADAGSLEVDAAVVDEDGLIQANSLGQHRGAIDVLAGDAIVLGPSGTIRAKGDPAGLSSGGKVTLKAANRYTDEQTSEIDISGGGRGGNGGELEICAPHMSAIRAAINGKATVGFVAGALTVDPLNILLSTSGSSAPPSGTVGVSDPPTAGTLTLNVNTLSGLSQINLQAANNIELNTLWTLADQASPATLILTAGNNITFDNGSGISAGNNWSVEMFAGPTNLVSAPSAGTDGIYLNGNSYIQTRSGNVVLWAANEVLVNPGSSGAVGNNGIRTLAGGSISVTTQFGNVNAGGNPQGFVYHATPPYYTVSSTAGGISTAAGGSVSITAGGNITSYLPSGTAASAAADAGSGAFGSQPGNVTLTAGGGVFGHYVLVNGTGSVTAGANAGNVINNPFALSLVKGGWTINAPNGSIYLQEVRNPNGLFNAVGISSGAGYHLFDYDPQASISLNASNGIYLTGLSLPRLASASIAAIYPPSANFSAGQGGLTLQDNVTLFPSPFGNLTITTTNGGDLVAELNNPELLMSDSSQMRWVNAGTFGATDHGNSPLGINDTNPVTVNVSGNMQNVTLITSKQTQITVGGDIIGCGFSGQNLHASDVTSVNVAGQISNPGVFSYVLLGQPIAPLPAENLPPSTANTWDAIFNLSLNSQTLANLTVPSGLPPSQLTSYALQNAAVFAGATTNSGNPGFIYDTSTATLGFVGQMPNGLEAALTQPQTVLRYGADGYPIVDGTGHFVTDTVTWVAPASIQTLFNESLSAPALNLDQLGYRIGGPGQFSIQANAIELGETYGILSCGVADPAGGFSRYANLASLTTQGATLNVTAGTNLDATTSTIAAIGGGDVNVNVLDGPLTLGSAALEDALRMSPVPSFVQTLVARQLGFGIFTSGSGNVNATALDNVDIDGSRIATFNGGNVFIESLQGNVDAGLGIITPFYGVPYNYVNPGTGAGTTYLEEIFGSGILAFTLVEGTNVPGGAATPGNITVETPGGSIFADEAGIEQFVFNGNPVGNPTITLTAGTPPSGGSPGYVGNIDLGYSGVVGYNVIMTATGNILSLTQPQNQPESIVATAGTNVQFTAEASGTMPIYYQWFKNGVSLTDDTNATLLITNVHRADAAEYSVVISNAAAVTTNYFQLHVLVPERLNVVVDPVNAVTSVSFGDADGGELTSNDIPSFVVQTSSNLVDWVTVNPVISTNPSGGLSFELPADPGGGFYRVISQ